MGIILAFLVRIMYHYGGLFAFLGKKQTYKRVFERSISCPEARFFRFRHENAGVLLCLQKGARGNTGQDLNAVSCLCPFLFAVLAFSLL